MNRFRSYVRFIINEGKIDDLKAKYTTLGGSLYPVEKNSVIDMLAEYDPSPTKKYLIWMCKQAFEGGITHRKVEQLRADMIPSIEYFHKNIHKFEKKDINSYSTAKELEDAVKEVASKFSTKLGASNAETLVENGNVIMVRPDNKSAVMKYGSGTRWCITMADASYYEQYVQANVVFYFVIDKTKDPKKNPMAKVAIAIQRDQDNKIIRNFGAISIFDADDNTISDLYFQEYSNQGTKRKPFIWLVPYVEHAKKDAPTRPKALLAKIIADDLDIEQEEVNDYWNSLGEANDAKLQLCWLLASHERDDLIPSKGIKRLLNQKPCYQPTGSANSPMFTREEDGPGLGFVDISNINDLPDFNELA